MTTNTHHRIGAWCAVALLLGGTLCSQADDFESAASAVANMRLGWNLGNTLDSNSGDTLSMWIEANKSRTTVSYETAWGQKVTKPELFRLFKEAGFNAIRVPVTWYPHMEATFNAVKGYTDPSKGWTYTPWLPSADDIGTQIQAQWMARVKEVVDYVLAQGMYCILNVHHDTGAANTAWLVADEDVFARQQARFEAVWTQIAETFRDYDEHLLFEGYNEMLDTKQSWCFASFAASGGYNAAIATSAYNAINSYAQSFVNAVRATGGNNAQRNLVVCTYGACSGEGTWNSHLQDPLKQMKLPTDVADGHVMFEVHAYPSIADLTQAKKSVDQLMAAVNTHLATKGAPVIFGEWGTSEGTDYDNRRANKLAFARYFVEKASQYGFGTFYWMGLSDGASRTVPEFNQEDLVEAIVKGYYGDNGYTAISPLEANPTAVNRPGGWYTLDGRRLAGKPTAKGLYVHDGQKVAVGVSR